VRRRYGQQDAHEFTKFLLDRLDRELQLTFPAKPTHDASNSSTANTTEMCPSGSSGGGSVAKRQPRNKSNKTKGHGPAKTTSQPPPQATVVESLFGRSFKGTLQNIVECADCKTRSKANERFEELTLPIPLGEIARPSSASHTSNSSNSGGGNAKRHGVGVDSSGTDGGVDADTSGNPSNGSGGGWFDVKAKGSGLGRRAIAPPKTGFVETIKSGFRLFRPLPAVRLRDCLVQHFAYSELAGENQYQCDNCHGKRDAKRWTAISQLPEVLVVATKRFQRSALGGFTKIDREVTLSGRLSEVLRFDL
jgi:hypothetical protein